MPGEKEVLKTTCPRDCYDACGIVAIKRDGAITRVLGDPDHPVSRGALCGKCALAYNGVFRDPDVRLQTPLKRTGAKGEGRFEPVSWDEAIGDIAGRFNQIAEGDGADKIVHAHYTGTCSLIANNFPMRFLGRLGAREVEPDTVCNMAGHVALDYVIGTSVIGFDPRTAKDSNCIVVWGANPSASGPHQHKHWLKEAPGTVIVIDPVRHPTAEQADIHLQPFPGSDAALAFAMVHVLVRDGLIDRAFLDAHALGWDELEPAIAPCTPAWGEARTGVPAAQIEEAARIYGCRAGATLARPGAATPGDGRQRDTRLRAAAGSHRQLRQARRGHALPQRRRTQRRRRRLSERAPRNEPEPAELQPDGACRTPGGPGGHPGLPLLEHQPGRLQPGAGASAPRAKARGSLHRGLGHLPDRHRRLCRLRAAGRVVPGVRRSGLGLLQPLLLRPGQAAGAAGRVPPQPGDLPPPLARHGLRGTRALRGRRDDHRADHGPGGCRGLLRRVQEDRHGVSHHPADHPVPRPRLPDPERQDRDRLGPRRGRRPPSPAACRRRPEAGEGPAAAC